MKADTSDDGQDSRPGRHTLVAIASSAGGIHALSVILGGLPGGFPAPIVVVQHLDPRHRTVLAELLSARSSTSGSRRRARSCAMGRCGWRRPIATCSSARTGGWS